MFSGKIVGKFVVEELGEVKVRYLMMEDVDPLQDLMNSLVDEGADIRYTREIGFEEQVDWVAEQLKKVEKGKRVQLVVEVDGVVVGSTSVERDEEGKDHVGHFGIVLAESVRGFGVGERTMRAVIEEARERLDVEIVVLEVYESNEVARNLYSKVGFEVVGRIEDGVCLEDGCSDVLIMEKKLK
ncbi:hypothetical protein C9439_08110 [archaeon SCG-AAA382B04]|nr:hypothetical protein C9439_08110 [archaeon SCG-AAA382B04]